MYLNGKNRGNMRKFSTHMHCIAKLIGLIGILKDFFDDEEKLKKLYRGLLVGLIAYIIGKTTYMSYKVFKQGFVKEIHRRIDDDDDVGNYPSADDPEFGGDIGDDYDD